MRGGLPYVDPRRAGTEARQHGRRVHGTEQVAELGPHGGRRDDDLGPERAGGLRAELVQVARGYPTCPECLAGDRVAGHHGGPADLAGHPGDRLGARRCLGVACLRAQAGAVPARGPARQYQRDHAGHDQGYHGEKHAEDAPAPPGPPWLLTRPGAAMGAGAAVRPPGHHRGPARPGRPALSSGAWVARAAADWRAAGADCPGRGATPAALSSPRRLVRPGVPQRRRRRAPGPPPGQVGRDRHRHGIRRDSRARGPARQAFLLSPALRLGRGCGQAQRPGQVGRDGHRQGIRCGCRRRGRRCASAGSAAAVPVPEWRGRPRRAGRRPCSQVRPGAARRSWAAAPCAPPGPAGGRARTAAGTRAAVPRAAAGRRSPRGPAAAAAPAATGACRPGARRPTGQALPGSARRSGARSASCGAPRAPSVVAPRSVSVCWAAACSRADSRPAPCRSPGSGRCRWPGRAAAVRPARAAAVFLACAAAAKAPRACPAPGSPAEARPAAPSAPGPCAARPRRAQARMRSRSARVAAGPRGSPSDRPAPTAWVSRTPRERGGEAAKRRHHLSCGHPPEACPRAGRVPGQRNIHCPVNSTEIAYCRKETT